jgi:3-dehydroquinate synthase
MSDYFKIVSSTGDYGVHIGNGIANNKINDPANQIIICDKYFAPDYQNRGLKVISIAATETAKSLDKMSDIIIAMRNFNANRNTTLLAIGGGVIQDIATFVASIYMRGLKWDYLPTTLLGMVDSCIGGKSSINVGNYKNLIGNFYPPENIVIDLQFINTLNDQQIIAGLCEAVKICFAHTGNAFERYIDLNPQASSSPEVMKEMTKLSLLTKRWFIEIDEHDHKERLLLNFGHTFGHAIEGSCNFAIPHGIAVGMGMLAAIEFSRVNNHFSTAPTRVRQLENYTHNLLSTITELPEWTTQIAIKELMDRFNSDKKHTSTHYAVIVPDSAGQLTRLMIEKNSKNCDQIFNAFNKVCANYTIAN